MDPKTVEMDDDQKLEDVRKRLQKEKEIKAATMKLRDFQKSDAAKAACDATMEESQQRINYFQNEFDKLQLKKQQENSTKVARTHIPITLPSLENAPPMFKAGFDNSRGGSYQSTSSSSDNNSNSRIGSSRNNSMASSHYPEDFISSRPLSTVDLLKAPTPITAKKVTFKLRELAYKLDIEKKVKVASERLEQLGMSAKDGNVESSERVVLLKRALQKYQGLYIPGQGEDDITNSPGTALRRPMTGTLYVRISGIRHQNNAPTRNSRPAESMACIKIDGATKAKTRMARNGPNGIRWNEEFEVPVTKASEIEIAVFDKPDHVPVPIGMFWLKISDLVEDLRRKKVEADNDAAWVAANVQDLVSRTPTIRPGTGPLGDNPINGVEGIESWWDLEPIGQISLKFNFVKDVALRKRPSKLGRQGAVRKRKDEVREIQGHKFVPQKFFQIMCCALCTELFTGKGAQCEDCKFTCHQKCADKVFIKCISSRNVEDPDEAKFAHRIPHRFETFTNLSPTWCSHCGHMLTFGRRHKKCTECPVVAHDGCSDLVPNHCGMPAETANKLMEEIRRRNPSGRTPLTPTKPNKPLPLEPQPMEQKTVTPRPVPPIPQYDRPTLPNREETRPDQQSVSPVVDPNQARLQQQMQQLHIQQQQQELDHYQRKMEQQRFLEQQQQKQLYEQQQIQQQQQELDHYQRKMEQKRFIEQQQKQLHEQEQLKQQLLQQQQQKQQMEAERASRQQQEKAQLEDKFRNEQARLEQLRIEQEKRQQKTATPSTIPILVEQPQRPLVMPKPHIPTLKIVNKQSAKPMKKYGLNDFHFLAVLGKGNFGKVMLAEDKKDGGVYAIKALKKESIVKSDEIESARSEKRIYQVANKERHPFLTTLHSCFQTDTRLYFVMEYVQGGDLMMHIQKDKRFGEHRAKFYGCEVLLALQYFHENDIVYRDLKLDNILLSLDGHIKIGDYGLCKENMPYGATTHTICGTPEFMAPEILEEQPYDRAVDWWAYGVLMYEMLLGRAPFSGEEEDDIYDSILEDEPLYPHGFGRHEQALLQSLLVKVPSNRLGSGPTDAEEIKAHAYFRNVNFDDVYHKRIRPPFLPKVTSKTDVSNFDTEFTSEAPGETPTDYHIVSSHGVVESVYGETLGQKGRVLGSKIIRAENKKAQPTFTATTESGSKSAKAKKNNKKKGAKGKAGAAGGGGGASGKKAGGANEPQVLDPAAIKKRQRKAKEAFRAGRVLLEKLVEGSDLVLVVLDARDPQRCRSTFLERLVKETGKSLVFVLNKTDLVPRHNVEKWLEVLRQEHAAVAFSAVEESPSSSADALAQLVKAQATTTSNNTKPSITVGIVGFPSVGRASVLRSLRQSKELASSSSSSIVKFYVNLGALLNKGGHGPIDSMLRSKLLPGEDLVAATASILMRCKQQTLMITYSVPRFDTGFECLAALARQQGHLFKGGVPDILTTARSFLRELSSGKSPFFTNPPSVKRAMDAVGYGLSAEDDGFVLDLMVFSTETTGFSFALNAQKGLEKDPEDSGDEEEDEEEAPMLVTVDKEKQSKSKKQVALEQDVDEDEDEDEEEEEEEEKAEEKEVAPITTKRGAKSAPVQKRPVKKTKKSVAEEDGNAPYTFGEFA
ncbi:Serine/threonine kinase [Linnemannia schmuckeri]|uniref:protein kinase C n=1 Tax=Linnemannia schmuckeri TaxID=64567 RepID=A0A9P5V704_9FUNG|nr:Serine/threonine kinase [Linnemannia schmuckeri]